MNTTLLAETDILPLTCTRAGTCCHGAQVMLTPWELARLAAATGLSPRDFRDAHTADGGTRLRFTGKAGGPRLKPACDMYADGRGCTVHPARPLACRMYPLGRMKADGKVRYHHPGQELSCVSLCPSVQELPVQTVADYLRGQQIDGGTAAHDGYGRLVYGLLATAGGIVTRAGAAIDHLLLNRELVRRAGLSPLQRAGTLPTAWFDRLTIPDLPEAVEDPEAFVYAHAHLLMRDVQRDLVRYTLADAVLIVMTMALHLAPTVGTDSVMVVEAFRAYARGAATPQQPAAAG